MSEVEAIEIFGDNLRDVMRECGMNQTQLARMSGVSRSTINKYLNKTYMPNMKTIMNLCMALGCGYDELLPDYEFVF